MADFDMDVEEVPVDNSIVTVIDDDSKPSQQRVKVRRRLEDYLHLRRLREEVNYFVDPNGYNDDELYAYGLGEGGAD